MGLSNKGKWTIKNRTKLYKDTTQWLKGTQILGQLENSYVFLTEKHGYPWYVYIFSWETISFYLRKENHST